MNEAKNDEEPSISGDEPHQAREQDDSSSRESPWDRSNFLVRYSFVFLLPLIEKGYRHKLTPGQLHEPPDSDKSHSIGHQLETRIELESLSNNNGQDTRGKVKVNTLSILLKLFWKQLTLALILDLLSRCVCVPVQILAFGWLLQDTNSIFTIAGSLTEKQSSKSVASKLATITNIFKLGELENQVLIDLIILLLTTWLADIFAQISLTLAQHIGLKCRTACSHMLYHKSLRLNQSGMSFNSRGFRNQEITGLLGKEIRFLQDSIPLISKLIIIPIQTIVTLVICCYFFIGLYPALGGLVISLVFLIAQAPLGRALCKLQDILSARTHNRLSLVSRILMSIRFVKEQAWEEPFRHKIHKARRRELLIFTNIWIMRAFNSALQFGASKVIALVVIIIFTTLNYPLDPAVVFVTILVSEMLRLGLTLVLPYAISTSTELVFACRRLNAFMESAESKRAPENQFMISVDPNKSTNSIVINEIFVSWNREQNSNEYPIIISDLSLSIRHKELILILGQPGSGKSTFLMSLLGETQLENGRIEVNGKISFAPQEAWIFNDTIRENILMGNTYKESRYKEVLRVCGLLDDLESEFENGDKTLVGVWGQPLSDSLKCRINLARALYHQADIYLLDEPFLQLSSNLADEIFKEAIETFLRNKTVCIASRRLRYVPFTSNILVLDRQMAPVFGTLGSISGTEIFKKLGYKGSKEGGARELVEGASSTSKQSGDDGKSKKSDKQSSNKNKPRKSPKRKKKKIFGRGVQSSATEEITTTTTTTKSMTVDSLDEIDGVKSPTRPERVGLEISTRNSCCSFEEMTKRRKWQDMRSNLELVECKESQYSPYTYYARESGNFISYGLFLTACLVAQLLYNSIDYFLTLWTDNIQRHELEKRSFEVRNFLDKLLAWEWGGWYAILTGIFLLVLFGRSMVVGTIALMGSSNIHRRLIDSLILAPVNCFDFRSMEMMIVHMKRAITNLDESVPIGLGNFVFSILSCLGALIIICSVDTTNIVATLIFCSFAFQLAQTCSGAIVQMNQIENFKTQLVRSQLSNTLAGLSVIRNFKAEESFLNRFGRHLDAQSGASFVLFGSTRFLIMATDFLVLLFVTAVVCTKMYYSFSETNLSITGLLLSQSLLLPATILLTTMQLVELEITTLDLEKLRQLSQFKPEDRGSTGAVVPFVRDPNIDFDEDLDEKSKFEERRRKNGDEIRFIELTLRLTQNDLRPVLNNINLTILPGEKVGVVGQLGSGKSAIGIALLRLYPFERGHVEIDRIDTRRMSLNELRSSVSLVPAKPRLFGGSIRDNLDPSNEYSDQELWNALDAVQMRSLYSGYAHGLDGDIEPTNLTKGEGGGGGTRQNEYNNSNNNNNNNATSKDSPNGQLNVIQRQLIYLARAILRRNKILVFEESTWGPDTETDIVIESVIASFFNESTVIVIAQRLSTVSNSDRVLVLDQGQVGEFGSPLELVRDRSSLFSRLIEIELPSDEAQRLRQTIEENQLRRKGSSSSKQTQDEWLF